MRRVLVVRFSSLGDIILTFPSLRHLIDAGNEVHFLTKASFRPLLEAFGSGVVVHTIYDHASSRELRRKVEELKGLQFDFVYDLHRNLRSRLVTYWIGSPYRRVRKFRLRELALYVLRRGAYRSLIGAPINRALESLRVVGGDWTRLTGTSPDGDVRGNELMTSLPAPMAIGHVQDLSGLVADKSNGYVCISVESAWSQKEWAFDRFLAVARQLRALGFVVVWLGLRKLPEEAQIDGSFDLTSKLKIQEVGTILKGARVLVCNDSGLMHLSEAVGTPVVGVFGPTSRELGFAPRLSSSRIAESSLWCRPCSKTGRACFRPFERRKCLSEVSVDQVMGKVREVLGMAGADMQANLKGMPNCEDLDV